MPGRKRKIAEVDTDNSDIEIAEERVLSHAAQRRLRKRQNTIAATKEEAASSKPPDNTKQTTAHSIWVGNIAFRTTPQALKSFFGGELSEITRIHMPAKKLHGTRIKSEQKRGDNKGFAYVDFANPVAKERAIAKSESHLDGRALLIKDASDFAGRPDKDGAQNPATNPLTGLTKTARKILASQRNQPCQTLFCGNLSFETTEDEIAALFGRTHPKQKALRQGNSSVDPSSIPLLRVRMGTFEDSGKCKGFAFVDFKDTQSATEALTNPRNHSLNGRALVVEYASPDAVRRGQKAYQASDPSNPKTRSSRRPQKSERIAAKLARTGATVSTRMGGDPHTDARGLISSGKQMERSLQRKSRGEIEVDKTGKNRRVKPGASLENAQREKVAIVESVGKKITFD